MGKLIRKVPRRTNLLNLDFKPFISQFKDKYSTGKEF